MRRVILLSLGVLLLLAVPATVIRVMGDAATVQRLVLAAERSPEAVRRGRYVVLGPQFTGTAVIDAVRSVEVEVRRDRYVTLRYGRPGDRGEISGYPHRPDASLPWEARGVRLDYKKRCIIVRH